MPSYAFNATLVPSVLADLTFQKFGIYMGMSGGIYYAIIDPRRHNVHVWTKFRNVFGLSSYGYTGAARVRNAHVYTNGPMMTPGCGASAAWRYFSLLGPWYKWNANGPVIHRGAIIDPGCPLGINNAYFSRTGLGSFSCYAIGTGMPTGTEAIGGLVTLVTAGTALMTPSVIGVILSAGITCWGLIPLSAPVPASDKWAAEIPFHPGKPELLDGLVMCAGSIVPTAIASFPGVLLPVGVMDAVAMDGSDSVVMGSGANVFFDCVAVKDKIQEYGFACF